MNSVLETAKLFFHLGLIAFGGPAAHIAMFHREVIEKRNWMSEEHFVDLLGATSLIPGPNSTEMAIHCGFHRAGLMGLVAAGLGFLLPATIITAFLAYFYVEAQEIPNMQIYLSGIKPVALILVFEALRKLWKKAIKKRELILVVSLVFVLGVSGIGEVAALFLGSLIGLFALRAYSSLRIRSIEPISIFLVFLKVGSVLFGSGYVLVSYLQDEIVVKRGWLSTEQLADAITIGQLTPGPVLSTSTFVGFVLSGPLGALVATIGIFLPSFLFVYFLNPIIPKLRSSKIFGEILDVVNAGAIGLMAYALVPLGRVSIANWALVITTILLALLVYFQPKVSAYILVLVGVSAAIAGHFLLGFV